MPLLTELGASTVGNYKDAAPTALGIAAFPDTDALHVPELHRETACEIIGEEMFKSTGGVCCKVGGLRFVPPDTNSAVLPEPPQSASLHLFVLPTPPPTKPLILRDVQRSANVELCDSPTIRAAARIFRVEPFAEITTPEGRSSKVRLWR